MSELEKFIELVEACRALGISKPAQISRLVKAARITVDIIEQVHNRCMPVDRMVSRTKEEITDAEFRRIYRTSVSALKGFKELTA